MRLSASPDVSIVIVNWNSCTFLSQCLRSIFAEPHPIALEVIVIDNASYDGSEGLVRRDFANVKFIQGRENVGFARANNAAAEHASGRQFLFLNPDTEVLGNAIELMSQFLDSKPDAGAVGCKLLNSDGSLQTSCVQAFPSVINQLLDSDFLRRVFPTSRLWGTAAFLKGDENPIEVEALSGACVLVDRHAFRDVGGFSDVYFMYAEDMDLCFKLRAGGRRNFYVAAASVVHHGGQSSGASSESQFGNVLMRESIATFLRLRRGPFHAHAFKVALAFSALARISTFWIARIVTLGRYRPELLRSGMRKWSKVLRWTVGAEPWVKDPGARTN